MHGKSTQTCRNLLGDAKMGGAERELGPKSRRALFALLRFQFFPAPIAAETQTKTIAQKKCGVYIKQTKAKKKKIEAKIAGVVRRSEAW